MLINLEGNFHKLGKLTPPNANIVKKRVIEYLFYKITIGSSSTHFELGSCVHLIDIIPIGETIKSNEWMTKGNRIRLDACIKHHMAKH
jgi:hypothetical protein